MWKKCIIILITSRTFAARVAKRLIFLFVLREVDQLVPDLFTGSAFLFVSFHCYISYLNKFLWNTFCLIIYSFVPRYFLTHAVSLHSGGGINRTI